MIGKFNYDGFTYDPVNIEKEMMTVHFRQFLDQYQNTPTGQERQKSSIEYQKKKLILHQRRMGNTILDEFPSYTKKLMLLINTGTGTVTVSTLTPGLFMLGRLKTMRYNFNSLQQVIGITWFCSS